MPDAEQTVPDVSETPFDAAQAEPVTVVTPAGTTFVFMTRSPDKGGLGITSADVRLEEVPNWEAAGWERADR